MKTTDLAWIAGFFEGEGSVGCYRRKDKVNGHVNKSFSFNVCITQKDRSILEWIKDTFGGSIAYMERTQSFGTRMWRWDGRSSCAVRFLESIRPFIHTRRKLRQIRKAFSNMEKYRKHTKVKMNNAMEVGRAYEAKA